jgi:hypothetical protein
MSATELHKEVAAARADRQARVERAQKFVASEPIRDAVRAAKLDPQKIERAIPFLSDAELARINAQAEKIERDLAAGALSNEHLTYIVIALAAAVVVLIAK